MCGIFGVAFLKNAVVKDKKKVIELLMELGERTQELGSHSSGIMVADPFKITLAKQALPMQDFLKTEKINTFLEKNIKLSTSISETETYAIVGHCRYPTQGTVANNKNNHPIKVDKVAGVHCGHIRNDSTLFCQYSHRFKRIAEVDSEIIFQLINMHRKEHSMVASIQRAALDLAGNYLCAIMSSTDNYKLYIIRNYSNVSIDFYYNLGIIVFSSNYIKITAPAMTKLFYGERNYVQNINLEDRTGIALNLRKGAFYRFNLNEIDALTRLTV